MKTWLLAGNVPYLAVLLLCASALALGLHLAAPAPRIATVERGTVVLEAVLARPDASRAQWHDWIEIPSQAVLQKYRARGYLVIDTSRDEAGHRLLAAVPQDATDITEELRAAIRAAMPAATSPGEAPP